MTDDQLKQLARYKQRLDFYHTEDRHECTLIHYRMVWMLTFQGILLAGLFSLRKIGVTDDVWRIGVPVFLGSCSVYMAIRVGLAIKAAGQIVNKWHIYEANLFDHDLKNCLDNEVKMELEWYSIGRWRQFPPAEKIAERLPIGQAPDGRQLWIDKQHLYSFRIHTDISIMFVVLWIGLIVSAALAKP